MQVRRLTRTLIAVAVAAGLVAASGGAMAAPVPDPAGSIVIDPAGGETKGLALAGRRLVTGEAGSVLAERLLGGSGPLVAGPYRLIGSDLYGDFCNGSCHRFLASGSKTAHVVQVFNAPENRYDTKIVVTGVHGLLREVPVTPDGGGVYLHALSGSFLAYRVNGAYQLYDIDNGRQVSFPVQPPQPFMFALSGNTYWTPTAYSSGEIIGVDLRTGAQRSVTVSTGCQPLQEMDIQVVGRWLAWGCSWGGHRLTQGVYDLIGNRNIPVTAPWDSYFDFAELGDGYLVWIRDFEGYAIYRMDFTVDPPVTTLMTTMDYGQLSVWHGVRWAIDRSGGQVAAWAESTGKIHVIPLGVPASALSLVLGNVPDRFSPNGDGNQDVWLPVWEMSKPGMWTLVIRKNGLAVRTLTGSSIGTAIAPRWEGSSGGWARWYRGPANGNYTYTMTVTPADGVGAGVTITGSIAIADAPATPVIQPIPRRAGFR